MEKSLIETSEIKLIGLTARTRNLNELVSSTAKIGPLMKHYFAQNLANEIPYRKNPGVTIAGYTEYESDEYGYYTYFIGEEVSLIEHIPEHFKPIVIKAGKYQKFTTKEGEIPSVVINAWMYIWNINREELGGKRNFMCDFEIYDSRALDPKHAVVDIFIGIE